MVVSDVSVVKGDENMLYVNSLTLCLVDIRHNVVVKVTTHTLHSKLTGS